MKRTIKSAARSMTEMIGLDVRRTGAGLLGRVRPIDKYVQHVGGHPLKFGPSDEDRFQWLTNLGIRTVLDIGACNGGFALEIGKLLPNASVISCEPLADVFRELNANLAGTPNFTALNVALGREKGSAKIHHNQFAPCSSLLESADALRSQLPFAGNAWEEVIQVERLDDVVRDLRLEDEILVKIDVQGFEAEVIGGGEETLRRARMVLVETSFQEIYKEQPLFGDIYRLLVDGLGFRYAGSWDQQRSPVDGGPFQEDSIFLR